VPADQVDAQIEEALRRLVEFLGVERSAFAELAEDGTSLTASHCYVVPGYPPAPRVITRDQLPWYIAQVRSGEVLRFARVPDDVPPEAVREREFALATGMKSHLVIPLKVGGAHLAHIGFAAFRAYRDWPDELIQRLRLVGEIFASAVARERADRSLKAREDSLRRSQEELRLLAGRLLQAQEQERRRIAREMHDDWTQRLAVLAIEAAGLERRLDGPAEAMDRLRAMRDDLVRLSEDVHALSRQLHPAILDDLGLVDALRSECASFAQRERVAVTYRPRGVPASVPRDAALCVYRVAQEALRNVAKHAGVGRARLSLVTAGRGLVLRVEDRGKGFAAAGPRPRAGLGLSSMAERVRLVRGELTVVSEPGRGTMVTARVPLDGGGS
jgi:signal transduction histidine kinase